MKIADAIDNQINYFREKAKALPRDVIWHCLPQKRKYSFVLGVRMGDKAIDPLFKFS
jgi:hypothetical protein